jgi:hypothetical protein
MRNYLGTEWLAMMKRAAHFYMDEVDQDETMAIQQSIRVTQLPWIALDRGRAIKRVIYRRL